MNGKTFDDIKSSPFVLSPVEGLRERFRQPVSAGFPLFQHSVTAPLSFPTSLQELQSQPSQPVATSAWSRPSLYGGPHSRLSFRKLFARRRTRSSQCVYSTLD